MGYNSPCNHNAIQLLITLLKMQSQCKTKQQGQLFILSFIVMRLIIYYLIQKDLGGP